MTESSTPNLPESRRTPSRRGFLRGTLLGAGAAGAAAFTNPVAADGGRHAKDAAPKPSWDFRKASGQLEADAVVDSACQFCNANCALKVHVKAGRALEIRGEEKDPVQAGELCVKAPMMMELVANDLRLKRPLKRVSGEKGSTDSKFEECSWDEALTIIATRFLKLRDEGEARAIVNRTTGRMLRGAGSVIGRVMAMLGSPNATDVGPVCNDAGGNALSWTFGLGNFTNGYGVDPATGKEDLGSARLFLFLGTNQAETHPVTFAHLLREREKTGAKLWVVDPRLTPTGALADKHLAPKPHTDLALVLGMIGYVIAKGLVDKTYVAKWCEGYDELAAHFKAKGYSPEWAAPLCDLPAADIAALAEAYAKAKPAAIFCNAGISHQLNAFTTYRALAILASITGNVGVPGGGCNFMHNTWPGGLNLPAFEGELPKAGAALPVGPDRLAEAILTGKPYKVRAMMTEGNPLIASANTSRVKQAMKALEFYVYTGLFMEEAAWYADVVLPVTSGLETEGVYMRRDDRAIRWQDRSVAPVGESKTDIEIWVGIARKLAELDSKNSAWWTTNVPAEWSDYKVLWKHFSELTPGVGGMTRERMKKRAEPLRWPCPSEQHPGVSTMYLDDKSWYEAVEDLSPQHKGKRFLTDSGKIQLYTKAMNEALQAAGHSALPEWFTHPEVKGANASIEYSEELVSNPITPGSLTPKVKLGGLSSTELEAKFPLMGMIGRASVVHFAGVTQWTPTGKRMNGLRFIQIHPKAAAAAGVKNGDAVVVESPRGKVTGTAALTDGIREDTVFVPNSFGPAQAMGDRMLTPRYEAANTLVDDRYFDSLSGQQAYKCFACRVTKA